MEITKECLDFVENQDEKTNLKFYQLLEVITEIKIVNSNFVKKLQDTHFYELRIRFYPYLCGFYNLETPSY